MEANLKLLRIKKKYNLSATDIAMLLDRSIHTVRKWITPPTKDNFRKMPTNILELLIIKIEASRK